MMERSRLGLKEALRAVPKDVPVLVAGPTASGKSGLALDIAAQDGGEIVNADASQVYACWRILTARPSPEEEAQTPHHLYGHVGAQDPYSTGHWLREVQGILKRGKRPIVVGGTGLYFQALTQGLAEIPPTPDTIRMQGNDMTLDDLLEVLDDDTRTRIDIRNRARVQRAWEVQATTGRGLAFWQDQTGPPVLPLPNCYPIVFDVDKDWLNERIARRFDLMLEQGALTEAEAVRPDYNPSLPAHRAIGVPELMRYIDGASTIEAARDAAVIATRQYAKRQRTWMRSKMSDWNAVTP